MGGEALDAFEHFKKWVDTNLFVLTLIGFALLAVRFVFEFAHSFKLLRRFHKNEMSGNFIAVMGTLTATYVRSIEPLHVRSWIAWGLFNEVRRRLEYEVIHPRHQAKSGQRWRSGLKIAQRAKNPVITAHTSKDVASAEERVRRYFEAVNRPLGFFDLLGWLAAFAVLGAATSLLPKEMMSKEFQNAARFFSFKL